MLSIYHPPCLLLLLMLMLLMLMLLLLLLQETPRSPGNRPVHPLCQHRGSRVCIIEACM